MLKIVSLGEFTNLIYMTKKLYNFLSNNNQIINKQNVPKLSTP